MPLQLDNKSSDLLAFGYAPGNYMFRCHDCSGESVGDKRSLRCKECAEQAMNNSQQSEVVPSKDVVLLACPFCGGSVEVGHYHPDLGPSSCFVKCWCGARGTEHQYQHGDHKEAIAKAAASWNRRTVETTDDMQILRGIVNNQSADREFLTLSMALLRRIVRAEEPAGVRIAPEKPIIDGHPIGCMCHGCHYYRKHPQCKPVKAPVCTCDSPAAGPCPAHT